MYFNQQAAKETSDFHSEKDDSKWEFGDFGY